MCDCDTGGRKDDSVVVREDTAAITSRPTLQGERDEGSISNGLTIPEC
jgi:hypothetical protein